MKDNSDYFHEVQYEPGGWSVIDRETKDATLVQGVRQVGLSREDADNVAEALNAMEAEKSGLSATSTESLSEVHAPQTQPSAPLRSPSPSPPPRPV